MNNVKIRFNFRRMVCMTLAALLCVSAMSGCAKADTKTAFTKAELLADYDALWEMLEEDYLYFPILESRGISIKSIKEDTRRQLNDRITDLRGFYYLLSTMFEEMQCFAHLSLLTPDAFDVYEKYYNTESEENGWQKALQNPQTQAIYVYLKSELGDRAGLVDETDSYRAVEAAYDAQHKAVTFVVPTFNDAVLERDRHFIGDYLTSLGEAKIEHIIFDISGNAGGNDLYWQENIVAPFGGDYAWTNYLYLRDTESTQRFFFDNFNPQPIGAMTDHTVPDFVKDLGLTHFIKNQNRLSNDASLADRILAAKRWVIIDDRVYSSADSFSAFCKATGWATLIGQTTLGDGQGASPIVITLPNTGLLVRFSALAAETPGGTLNVVNGIEPDVPVDPQKISARDAIDRLIEEEVH